MFRIQCQLIEQAFQSLSRTHADLRFLVVDDEADEVRVAWRAEVLPGQRDGVTCCDVGHEL